MTSAPGGSAKCSRTGRPSLASQGAAAPASAARGHLGVELALKRHETPGLHCPRGWGPLASLDTAGDELGARSPNVGNDQVHAYAEPGAADVTPVPNWIEHSEPGGVSWTMRKLSPAERSAPSLRPRLP